MPLFRDMSINRKLTLIIMLASGTALLVACAALFVFDMTVEWNKAKKDLTTEAKIMAANCAAALMFDDAASAEETLSTLVEDDHVTSACIFAADGSTFATYLQDGAERERIDVRDDDFYLEDGCLCIYHPIVSGEERIGTVHIESDLREIYVTLKQYVLAVLMVVVLSTFVAFLASSRLQRLISGPIHHLVQTAEKVATEKDYTVRAEKQSDDELGLLVDEFNRMLGEIDQRDAALQEAHADLEDRVRIRTRELRTEIGERTRAEKALRASEERYRELFNTMISAFALHEIICDEDGKPIDYRFLEVNASFEKMMGLSAKKVVGRRLLEVLPKTKHSWIEMYGKVALTGESMRFEDYSAELGKHFEVIAYSPEKGKFATVFSDITSRKLAEEAQARLATAVEQAVEAIVITDTDGTIQYVNPAFEQITGYTTHEAIGRNPSVLKSGEHENEFYKELWDTILAGEVWSGRLTNKRKDGTLFEWEITISPVRDSAGEIVNFVAVNRDVTEQTALENQLRQAQKMEAIGQLAGGVAHDFNNLLTGILGYANILKSKAETGDRVYRSADVIEVAANRAAQLTEQLLGFARKGKHQNVPVDLHDTINEAINLLSRTIDKRISIRRHFRARKAAVLGDPGQMQQVLLNLAINARDAMPEGGDLTFETDIIDLDTIFCQTHPGTVPGRYVMASVSDTGCGIPYEVRDRIFEPFFTTKELGKGTGMGLAMAYGIVKNHNGSIWVYSEADLGTVVKVYLPLFGFAKEASEKDSVKAIVRGSGRVLLVDDEEIVRSVAAAMLKELGYDVVQAANGLEAVDIFKEVHNTIDLAIIDMIMPHMGGRECYIELKKINPNVRAILSTGYGLDGTAQEILDLGMNGFIQKPYVLREMSEAIAQGLDLSSD